MFFCSTHCLSEQLNLPCYHIFSQCHLLYCPVPSGYTALDAPPLLWKLYGHIERNVNTKVSIITPCSTDSHYALPGLQTLPFHHLTVFLCDCEWKSRSQLFSFFAYVHHQVQHERFRLAVIVLANSHVCLVNWQVFPSVDRGSLIVFYICKLRHSYLFANIITCPWLCVHETFDSAPWLTAQSSADCADPVNQTIKNHLAVGLVKLLFRPELRRSRQSLRASNVACGCRRRHMLWSSVVHEHSSCHDTCQNICIAHTRVRMSYAHITCKHTCCMYARVHAM